MLDIPFCICYIESTLNEGNENGKKQVSRVS